MVWRLFRHIEARELMFQFYELILFVQQHTAMQLTESFEKRKVPVTSHEGRESRVTGSATLDSTVSQIL